MVKGTEKKIEEEKEKVYSLLSINKLINRLAAKH